MLDREGKFFDYLLDFENWGCFDFVCVIKYEFKWFDFFVFVNLVIEFFFIKMGLLWEENWCRYMILFYILCCVFVLKDNSIIF